MSASCNCGARWTGLRMEHCTVCHRTFSGTSTGDAHRVGEHGVSRRCLTDAELTKKGFRLTDERAHLWRGKPRPDSPWPNKTSTQPPRVEAEDAVAAETRSARDSARPAAVGGEES